MTVDTETDVVTAIGGKSLNPEKIYMVAMPRNRELTPCCIRACSLGAKLHSHSFTTTPVLSGFCDIKPLVDWGIMHSAMLPDEDSFTPALNVVLNRNAGDVWLRLGAFEELDQDKDGSVGRCVALPWQ